jgi:putative Mg2+ transporter-C (MgtC) family protein
MTVEYILNIFLAAILGGAIGFEREYRSKEAGFRTHFLVGLGSALFMVLSMHGFDDFVAQPGVIIQRDPARMAAQVVSGIGFIGAGTIIFQKNVVKGLTTAAGLWVTSAIGMTASVGMYAVAISSTIMVLVCLEGMNFIHHHIFGHQHREYDADDKNEETLGH